MLMASLANNLEKHMTANKITINGSRDSAEKIPGAKTLKDINRLDFSKQCLKTIFDYNLEQV